jgi:hypothetical protein
MKINNMSHNNNQRQDEFKNKLYALLREYNITVEVQERYVGYAYLVDGINFYAPPEYNADCNLIHNGIDFNLGNYSDHSSP